MIQIATFKADVITNLKELSNQIERFLYQQNVVWSQKWRFVAIYVFSISSLGNN